MALIIYVLAGVGFAWSYSHDKWWQRALLVPFWLPMVGWGVACEIIEAFQSKGYHYPEEEDQG